MLKWRGFQCGVRINGERPITYDDLEVQTDKRSTSCWIASKPGKEYKLEIKIDPHHPDLGVDLTIDGECIERNFIREGEKYKGSIRGREVENATKLRKFKFALIHSTEDDDEAARDISGLGSIRFDLFQCTLEEDDEEARNYVCCDVDTLDQEPKVNEKHNKAGLHCTSLGKAQPLPDKPDYFLTNPVPIDTDDFRHIFIFKYRPIEYLQARGIAPLPRRSRRGLPSEDPEDEKDPDLVRELSVKEEEEEDELQDDDDYPEEIHILEEQQKLLAQRLDEEERLQRDAQERQERFRQDMQKTKDDLSRLRAERSKPRSKRIKLEYHERLQAINGQVFEISD